MRAWSSQRGTELHSVGDTSSGTSISLISSTPCRRQETHQLRAQISHTWVVMQMDNSRDLDLDGTIADVKAWYEDIARRSQAEAQAWYESKVRKPGRGRIWVQFLFSDQLQTQRNTPDSSDLP